MQHKILVPLDGSKVGEAALPYVTKLISMMSPEVKVEVTLLGVVTVLRHWVVVGEASTPVSYTEEEFSSIRKGVADNLEKTAATLRQQGITVNMRVSTGNAAEEILRTADEIQADMIAMSTHGRSGLRRLAYGSVTDKVLHGARIPILVVRAPAGMVN
jgi:nucleotide-binding universal stress UspA family protein